MGQCSEMSSDAACIASPAAVDLSATKFDGSCTPEQHQQQQQQQHQQQQQRSVLRCGDAWRGAYRPTLFPGRGRCTEGDIRDICCDFLLILCNHIAETNATATSTTLDVQQDLDLGYTQSARKVVVGKGCAFEESPPQQHHQQQRQQQQQRSRLPAEGSLELFLSVDLKPSGTSLPLLSQCGNVSPKTQRGPKSAQTQIADFVPAQVIQWVGIVFFKCVNFKV